jgi:hypothetical protein
MKLSGLLFCSLALNTLLSLWLWNSSLKTPSHKTSVNSTTNRTVRAFAPVQKAEVSGLIRPRDVLEIFAWSQLESEDYRVYAANLRKLGCPQATVQDIIIADVNEMFYRRVNDLVGPVQNRFWELMTKPKEFQQVVDEKWKELKELDSERSLLLRELLGKFQRTSARQESANLESSELSRQFVDFLSSEKADEYFKLEQRFVAAHDALNSRQPPLSQNELQIQLKKVQERQDEELAQLLSSDELEEYRLRKSGFADLRHKLPGFQATGDELRELARIENNSGGTQPAERRERMREFLGPDRFTEFERAQSPQYQEIYQVAERFELATQAIGKAFEMRNAAEENARGLREDKSISLEARTVALKEIQMETTRALTEVLGPEAFGTYRSRSGQWLDELASKP